MGAIKSMMDQLAAYGMDCSAPPKPARSQEAGLLGVFAVHPLLHVHQEASRATQRGARLLHEGAVDEALQELQDARQLAPHSHEACGNLGCAYHARGDDNEAIHWYREALNLSPRFETAVLALALLEQRHGKVRDAERMLRKFLEQDCNNIGALRQLGRLHQREGQFLKAAECFRHLTAVEPTNGEWQTQLQSCYDKIPVQGAGDWENDQELISVPPPRYEAAAAGRQGTSPPVVLQAQALRRAGRVEAALALLQRSQGWLASNAEVLLECVACQKELGDTDAALEVSKQLLAAKPDDAEANLCVAELLLEAGHGADMADPYLRRVERAIGGDSGPLRQRLIRANAEAAISREDFTKALASASEAIRLDAAAPENLLLLGRARICVADYQASIRALKMASGAAQASWSSLAMRRLSALALTYEAHANERLRQYQQALDLARQALELYPELLQAQLVRAVALHQNGQTQQARRELEILLQGHPNEASARLQLGYCQLCSMEFAAAVSTLEEVLLNPATSRSQLGATKVYIAIALEMEGNLGPRNVQSRSEALVREGLCLHKNLQHIWQQIETGQLASKGVAAVQQLRAICDLDLTSVQARSLLRILSQISGRPELAPAGGGSGYVTPNNWSSGGSAPSRPARTPGNLTPAGSRPGSFQLMPFSVWQQAASGAATPGCIGKPGALPASWKQPGPGTGRADNPLTIGWNELIKPEQLIFGPQLGAGGSAQVYRGSWNGQEVAIKKINGGGHIEEMKKEINALRRLRHPRLVRFIGACVQPPLLLVVTEFMPGGSLHDRIFVSREAPLRSDQQWLLACQMAEGLSFLHAQRVVHRDLKSMNILLDAQQNAKICDFGLAHQMCMESTHIARRLDGEGGSPRYMAPECYDAVYGKLTDKVDIWALGCILIELFGKVLPYADCTTMPQLTARILVEKRPPAFPPTTPMQIATIIQRCHCFNPLQRCSAAEVQNGLLRLRQQ